MSQLAEPCTHDLRPVADVESLLWLSALSDTSPEREDAAERLHALLLRTARFEVARRQRARRGAVDADDLAVQAADDALVAILSKLRSFRGDSRFTTGAQKFVVLEAAAKVRKTSWRGRELPREADGWAQLHDDGRACPDRQPETSELIGAVRAAIAEVLTEHERAVLVALMLNDVPIDVLAERRHTTAARSTRPCTTPAASYGHGLRRTASRSRHRRHDHVAGTYVPEGANHDSPRSWARCPEAGGTAG